MNDHRQIMLDKAIKQAWSRRESPRALPPGARAVILARVAEHPVPSARRRAFFVTTPAASGLAWAASVLAIVAGVFGVKALAGLSLTANYMALFFLA